MHLASVVIAHVDPVDPGLPFKDVALENLPDSRIVDVVPRNLVGLEELVCQGLRPVVPGFFGDDGAEEMMYTSLILGTLKME